MLRIVFFIIILLNLLYFCQLSQIVDDGLNQFLPLDKTSDSLQEKINDIQLTVNMSSMEMILYTSVLFNNETSQIPQS